MRRVILDTDLAMGAPGSDIDDGFALALALADPEMSVDLVTTVNGNTDVDTATALTLGLLDRLGRSDIPVVRGASHPLTREQREPTRERLRPRAANRPPSRTGYAALALVDAVLADPGMISIVGIGPLTNIALALAIEPAVAEHVQEIVVMGGVFLGQTNNARMPGEFNTFTDPEATAIVLASGAPLRFVGLDVTRRVRLTREHTSTMASGGSVFGRFAADCANGWIEHLEHDNPGDQTVHGSCALHDPLAVAAVSRPDLLTWRHAKVSVETSSPMTRGVMVADLLTSRNPLEPNCQIAVAVDVPAFLELFLDRVSEL